MESSCTRLHRSRVEYARPRPLQSGVYVDHTCVLQGRTTPEAGMNYRASSRDIEEKYKLTLSHHGRLCYFGGRYTTVSH